VGTRKKQRQIDCRTWYIEYKVVGAVKLTSWVYGSARVHAVIRSCNADDLDTAVVLSKSNSLTAKQSANQKSYHYHTRHEYVH